MFVTVMEVLMAMLVWVGFHEKRLVEVCNRLVFPTVNPVTLNKNWPAEILGAISFIETLLTVMVIEFVPCAPYESVATAVNV